ncbi:RNA polymerase sigma factor [Asticcacaulis sp. AND118]|uniref:RNA polymerase sigma factor n=1 Tax=Asticcacaulis sp. AND118 TaxID=2840468 RepID=UPI001CFFB007|nr:sigma-70 family RNA polymerase sigma factor [Asticcacaulis sp. AND118]UDF05720.1 sigma-70 family RNA polymerase sigma factor [Asticcacaulis sp. AND118]
MPAVRCADPMAEEWADLRQAVARYALNVTRHPDLAEDIAQQTLLKAIEYQQSNIVISMHALAFRIAANLVREHYRRQKPVAELDAAHDIASSDPLPDRIAEDRAETRAMMQVLNAMPPLRRDVFLRRRVEGQSCQEIGRELGLNPKAVEKHITRALGDLHAARQRWQARHAEGQS